MKLACYNANILDRYIRKIASPFGSAVKRPHRSCPAVLLSDPAGNCFSTWTVLLRKSQLAQQIPPSFLFTDYLRSFIFALFVLTIMFAYKNTYFHVIFSYEQVEIMEVIIYKSSLFIIM